MPDKLPPNVSLEPVPFEEAITFFKKKVPMTESEFISLAAEHRASAFVVSGVSKMDILMDLHAAVLKAIEEGETLEDFQGRFDQIAEADGWEGGSPWRSETMFRTNVQTAYNAGRYEQMVEQVDRFPDWEYVAVDDADTRPEHAALNGKIFPANSSFWDTWYPPNGFNCRCTVVPVHEHVMEQEGLKEEAEDPTGGMIEPRDPQTGNKLPARPLIPDPGWDRNPAKDVWEPDLTKYPDELVRQFRKEEKEQ